MIIVYHQNNKVVEVDCDGKSIPFSETNIAKTLFNLSSIYSNELLIWCHVDLKSNLNLEKIEDIFHHNRIMATYNIANNSFLNDAIGYIEESPFIKINKKVNYPTWQMSSHVGGLHASILMALGEELKGDKNFDFFLHSMAKLAMPKGLFSYSAPQLLKNRSKEIQEYQKNNFLLFRFAKQHYKGRWVFLLFFNLFLYERKIALLPFLSSLFYRKRKLENIDLKKIEVNSTNKVIESGTIDVIIPTIGRKKYLYDVLKDLSIQTLLPGNVIIVEQNPDLNSVSELNFIIDEKWPFKIKHTFTHQAGACNARNIALSQVESEWVFLNDDDNRFDANLLENFLFNLKKFGLKSLSTSYLQLNEIKDNFVEFQSSFFGSGNSFIQSVLLSKIKFNIKFEFGYGEDADFGMQLRNLGVDVICFPNLDILHLKAPMGGFRTKPVLAWSDDIILPKPSPTIMLYKQLHLTKQQQNGYKTILFFKFYRVQKIKNPFMYFLHFKKQWNQSLFWSNKLKKV